MLEGRPSGGGRRAYQEKVMGLQERIGEVCQEKKNRSLHVDNVPKL